MTRARVQRRSFHADDEVFRIVAIVDAAARRPKQPRRSRGWTLLVALLSLACTTILGVGCDKKSSPAPPATVATVAAPRIVVLSPALAVLLRDLGLEPMIVGRHAWDLALDPALPVCGDQSGVDLEALLKVQPTHVVLQWGQRPLPQRLVDLARQHAWTIVNENPLALDDIPEVGQRLARAFEAAIAHEHSQERATALIEALNSACRKQGDNASPRPTSVPEPTPWKGRILLLAATSPPAALGPSSWHHEILSRLGGVNAITSGGPYQTLDAEDVTRLAPDAVVIIQPRARTDAPTSARNRAADFDPADFRTRLGPLADLDLPAITSGRIALIDDPLALTPSSSIIEVRKRLEQILAAWAR